ncbi:PqiC family protein [Pelagicoccus sp. SDUM812003]|uniref:PqiC family protein n=1 Tax=Pelagicoccus sp. SDUM812003 TaxID=3041267 RepID=UPI00280ED43E|nr:PqiC family protein [Pelagicoccus sp. SDUM812003]MDQ8201765.1 PqiC family protein [Pelagicoccus sp. SDUM812003]
MRKRLAHRVKLYFGGCVALAVFAGASLGCRSAKPQLETSSYVLLYDGKALWEGSLEVGSIEMPAYLDRSGIVLQLDGLRMHAGRYHLWGEPLEAGMRRVLGKLLDAKGGLARDAGVVRLQVERFHGTQEGSVAFEGSWKVDPIGGELGDWRRFSIESSLQADGYPALVAAHVSCLKKLCDQIVTELGPDRG